MRIFLYEDEHNHNDELISAAVDTVAAVATAAAPTGFDLDDVVVSNLPAAGLTARTGFFATTCDCAFNKFCALFICANCASEI